MKRWKTLKDTFRKELRKEKLVLSGSAASHPSKWVHFKNMDFLRDTMKPRQMSGNLTIDNSYVECMELNEDESQTLDPLEVTPNRTSSRAKRKLRENFEFLELERRKLMLLEKDKN